MTSSRRERNVVCVVEDRSVETLDTAAAEVYVERGYCLR